MVERNFLHAIASQSISNGEPIELRKPASITSGAVNIFCGRNHVGKTFLLKQIAELCRQSENNTTATNQRVTIHKLRPGAIKLLRANLFEMKNKFGRLKTVDAPRDNYQKNRAFYLALIRLIWMALSPGAGNKSAGFRKQKEGRFFDYDRFPNLIVENANGFRRKILERLDHGRPVYPGPLCFAALQEYLGADIGVVRLDSNVELVFREGSSYCPFSEWSDGLKALGCLEAVLYTKEHELLLIDELENHLHPTFITAALRTIKSSGIQAIVTSHHPHLIFSTWADEVIYLERRDGGERRPNRYRLAASTLETDFEKISKSYNLFSEQDNLLMKQGAFIRDNIDLAFFNAFVGSFAFEVVEEKAGGPRVDGQTQGLMQLLGPSLSKKTHIRVIDLGAGRGRSFFELKQKFATRRTDAELEWSLWEPNPSHRNKMEEKLASQKINGVNILRCDGEIKPGWYDVVYIANVLHELGIDEFVDLITTAVLAVSDDGVIIISEIFPLLHPEWFAVPYEEGDLKECFRESGFRPISSKLSFRSGEGYCMAFNVGGKLQAFDPDVLRKILSRKWKQIRADLMKDYKDHHTTEPLNVGAYIRAIQGVMTIARITDWEFEKGK